MALCNNCGEEIIRCQFKCHHCGHEFPHRHWYPEQYEHPKCGRDVEVLHKGKVVARGVVERVVTSRFGQLAKLDSTETWYLVSACRPVD